MCKTSLFWEGQFDLILIHLDYFSTNFLLLFLSLFLFISRVITDLLLIRSSLEEMCLRNSKIFFDGFSFYIFTSSQETRGFYVMKKKRLQGSKNPKKKPLQNFDQILS